MKLPTKQVFLSSPVPCYFPTSILVTSLHVRYNMAAAYWIKGNCSKSCTSLSNLDLFSLAILYIASQFWGDVYVPYMSCMEHKLRIKNFMEGKFN